MFSKEWIIKNSCNISTYDNSFELLYTFILKKTISVGCTSLQFSPPDKLTSHLNVLTSIKSIQQVKTLQENWK